MAKRVRHHVNPLKSSYVADSDVRAPVPDHGEVEVELGCADAKFLFERAACAPRRHHVGIEIRRDLVDDVNARAAAQGLGNLCAVFANINVSLGTLFSDGRLARVFVNFPDPWFKRRHQKRRLVTPELAVEIARKLAPGGILFFQSDVFDLALDALATIEDAADAGLYVNERGPWSFTVENSWGARSLREVRCEEKGMRIWRMSFVRTTLPVSAIDPSRV